MVTLFWFTNMNWLSKANRKEAAINSATEIIQGVLNNSMDVQTAVTQLRSMMSRDMSVCDMLLAEHQAAMGANHANLRALEALYQQVCAVDAPKEPQAEPLYPEQENIELGQPEEM